VGVPQFYEKAHMWFSIAAALGEEKAQHNKKLFTAKLTAAQISDAQRKAGVWLQQYRK
jgi:hypothetical protein